MQAHHRRLRSEPNLILEEVLQLLVTDRLISISINPSNQRIQLRLLEKQSVRPKEVVQVDGVNAAFVCSVDGPVDR